MIRKHMDERHPASGYAPTDDSFDPLIDDFVSKKREYVHFDLPLSDAEREKFSPTAREIAEHSFWPLLGFTKVERKAVHCADQKRVIRIKSRDIKFGSHADAAHLEFYTRHLSKVYEDYLLQSSFAGSILAYRSGVGDNVIQARDLFDDIKSMGNCTAIAMDIKGFFDNIDHVVLLNALKKIMSVDRLSDHHFKVYERMSKFEWVCSTQLAERLGRKNPINGRLCNIHEFRQKVRRKNDSIIRSNSELYGIPQGTPISGLYANISMLEFDRILHNYIAKRGGHYRRYSDDIALLLPDTVEASLALRHVRRELKKIGLKLNDSKTEVSVFRARKKGLISDKPFQYLGFTFDGKITLIRQSSISRYYKKMNKGVRAKIRAAYESNVPRDAIFLRELFKKYTHFGQARNFPQYAFRAATVLDAPEIRGQLRGHMPKFKRTIKKHTDRVYGKEK